ncbi:blue light receptor [Xylographa trunciseda]|nr:blue light receptor [Xylographa trunciseda]
MSLQNVFGRESLAEQNGRLPAVSAVPPPADTTTTYAEAIDGAEVSVAVARPERRDVSRAILKRSSSGRVIGPRASQPSAGIPAPEAFRDYTDKLIYPGLYAPSGFDMMSILVTTKAQTDRPQVAVAMRPNPRIIMGPIDASCALLLCDATKTDMPIVYASDAFEQLTGYTSTEITGLNCRFLQSPDGNVQAGVRRTHVNDETVFRLKRQLLAREEVQTSLVNYTKGGRRFTNFLTTIPVQFKTPEQKTYIVGFLADVSDQFWVG